MTELADEKPQTRVFCGDCKHKRFEEFGAWAYDVCNAQGSVQFSSITQYTDYPLCSKVNEHNDCSLFEWSRWKRFLHFLKRRNIT
jgi:hypothetical protein